MAKNIMTTLSVSQLKRAVAVRVKIDRLHNQLDRIVGVQVAPVKDGSPRRKRRGMSAAARAKISAAAKARWAKFRAKKAKK